MKYIQSYKLFENVKDDNLLMEIVHVLSQRLLEDIAIEVFSHNDRKLKGERVQIFSLYLKLVGQIKSNYLTTLGDVRSATEFGYPKRDVVNNQKIIKNIFPKYKPKYNKMSKKAFKVFQELLAYINNTKVSNTGSKIPFFIIDFIEKTSTNSANYNFPTSKISLYVSQIEFIEYVNMFDDGKGLNFLNDGLLINAKKKTSLFHEMRHLYDDYLSKGKFMPKVLVSTTSGSLADYTSQTHEISAVVSEFIQQIKLGYNSDANKSKVTMDSSWKDLKKVVYKHFKDFIGYESVVRNKILSKISKEWIDHNQKNKK